MSFYFFANLVICGRFEALINVSILLKWVHKGQNQPLRVFTGAGVTRFSVAQLMLALVGTLQMAQTLLAYAKSENHWQTETTGVTGLLAVAGDFAKTNN